MLHHFPGDHDYHRAKALHGLEEKPPSSEEEAIDRLARLLPLLDDEIVPVWSSPAFPVQPVALVTFVDKREGVPLVAVVCEFGTAGGELRGQWEGLGISPDSGSLAPSGQHSGVLGQPCGPPVRQLD